MCVALWWFWDVRGFLREGREWLERALAVNPEPTELRAQALIGLGTLARLLSDTNAAARLYRESLQINSALSNQRGMGGSLISLGIMALSGADYAQAYVWFTQAAEVWEQLADAEQLALVWNNLGYVAQMRGEIAEARRRYEASLAIHRNAGDKRSIAVGLYNLAELALDEDDAVSASIRLIECIDISVEIGDRYLLTHALRCAAALAGHSSHWHAAAELWSASERLREELEAPLEQKDRLSLERGTVMAKSAMNEPEFEAHWTIGKQLSLEDAVHRARAVLAD
jgi:non-specific serine/threonine protein kinase